MVRPLAPSVAPHKPARILYLTAVLATACASNPSPRPRTDTAAPVLASRKLAQVFANAGCRECHNADGAAADTRLVFPPPGAPAAIVDQAGDDLWDLADADDPRRSRLFRKPTKRMKHAGGEKIAPGSPEEETLLGWLAQMGSRRPADAVALRELMAAVPPSVTWPVRYQGTPSGLRRLSRDELVASLQLLIGIAPERADLPEDPRSGRGVLLTSGLPLLVNEVSVLRLTLRDLAVKAAPDVLAATGCALSQQRQRDCLAGWVADFAGRAFRRPPLSDETTRFEKMLDFAGASPEADVRTVEGILTAILFSPSFLYRSEIGTPVPGTPGVRALGSYEIATRLAFLATLTPPDAELSAAARAGRLGDGAERVRQWDRLAATGHGQHALALFVLEWLGAGENKIGIKDPGYSNKDLTGIDLGKGWESAVRASAESAIVRVLTESPQPDVAGLLTTRNYVGDAIMEKFTRAGSGDGRHGHIKREWGDDPEKAERVGLLMHPQVLAAHTKETGVSPFQIGVFLRDALLCQPVPAPPACAAATARTDVPRGLSTRKNLEFRTSAEAPCIGCHRMFAPLGYAFLAFDPVGRWVKKDATGDAWDLSGSLSTYTGRQLAFGSPADLATKLAADPQVHGCFAQSALEWTLGRALVPEDAAMVRALDQQVKRTHGNVAAIFRTIVADPGFATAVTTR